MEVYSEAIDGMANKKIPQCLERQRGRSERYFGDVRNILYARLMPSIIYIKFNHLVFYMLIAYAPI